MSARQGEFGLENPTHEKGVCNAVLFALFAANSIDNV
jgi:hypothetical protein